MPVPTLSPERARRGLVALYGLLLTGLIFAYALLAPPSRWDDPVTFGALAALAVIAVRCEAALPARVRVGSLPGLSLVAVALLGPLPALLVLGAALLTPALVQRERLLRSGNLANVAGHAAYVLAAAVVLERLGTGPLGLLAAAAAQFAINWLVGPALFTTLWQGLPFAEAVALGRAALASGVAVGALAALTVLATPVAGTSALALFALIVVMPQATLAYLGRSRPVADLDHATATARYARALAVEHGLGRAERDRVDTVARLVARRRPTGAAVDHMVATLTDRSAAACDAGHLTEWWDGTGGPANLHAGMIPDAARIVAVADAWATLTTGDAHALTHADAMAHLRAEAGQRLDPDLVACAERIAFGLGPASEPGLQLLAVPPALRRRFAPAGAPLAGAL